MNTNFELSRTPWRSFAALSSVLLAGAMAVTMATGSSAAGKSENTGARAGAPAVAGVNPAPAAVADAVPGAWTLAFDWSCDGSYSTTTFTANAGGTWSSGSGYTGLWVTVAGMLTFTFDNSETTYSGVLAAKSVTGIQSTFTGTNGCFYLLQSGAPTTASDSAADLLDEAGRTR